MWTRVWIWDLKVSIFEESIMFWGTVFHIRIVLGKKKRKDGSLRLSRVSGMLGCGVVLMI